MNQYPIDQSEQPYPFGNGDPETWREVVADIAARNRDRALVEWSWPYVRWTVVLGILAGVVWLWWPS